MSTVPTVAEMMEAISGGLIKPLTLKLFPAAEGYALVLPGKNCADSQTRNFKYIESELLDCVDQAEIPWFLSDLLEECPTNVYYKGCVAIRIKDQRQSKDGREECIKILRPSALSLFHDLNRILELSGGSRAEKLEIESKFWAAVSDPIPSDVSRPREHPLDSAGIRHLLRPLKTRRIHRKVNEHNLRLAPMRSSIAKCSATLKEARELNWKESIAKWKSAETKPAAEKTGGGQWKPMMRTKEPEELAERRLQALKQRPIEPEHLFESQIHRVEEIRVEMPLFSGKAEGDANAQQVGSTVTRIVISKHNYDSTYWGQLHLETPAVDSGPFFLGIDADARNYVYQYLDMVTEAGRRQPISVLRTSPSKGSQTVLSPQTVAAPSGFTT